MEQNQEGLRKSKVGKENNRLNFDKDYWVVSLLNTGGLIVGAHAKIIVEGSKRNTNSVFSELFVAEYHIMESNQLHSTESTIPPALKNVKGKAVVLIAEKSRYGTDESTEVAKLKQYATCTSSSWRVECQKVNEMIKNIKDEKINFDDKGNYKDFQYAGNMRLGSRGQGHNCVSWCMDKLTIADIKIHEMPTDSIKAIPEKHANPMVRNYDMTVERIGSTCCII